MVEQDLARKVGRLIIGKIPGPIMDENSRRLLADGIMGGVVLFKANAQSIRQLLELVTEIHALAEQAIVSVDQEGGAVQRFDHVLTPLPSAAALGVSPPAAARAAAVICGKQLALAGINCVLAPVLDVNTNRNNPIIGTRAYGDTPDLVIEHALEAMRGFLETGVLPVGKHFPGHGDTALDSHLDLPCLEHSLERLDSVELVPFRLCLDRMPALLTAHVWVRCLDDDVLPGTLSQNVTGGLLRKKLGFDGLVFTDDMLMKGLTKGHDVCEAALMAVEAGADQLLVCGTAEQIEDVHKFLLASVESGRLTLERISKSLKRRAEAFRHIRISDKPLSERISELERSTKDEYDPALQLALKGITVERGSLESALTPRRKIYLLLPDHPRYPLEFEAVLGSKSELKDFHFEAIRYPVDPQPSDIEGIAPSLAGQVCWMFTFRAVINRGQLALAQALADKADAKLLVACDLPYDLDEIDGYPVAVAVRDPSQLGVEGFVRRLCDDAKKITPSGKGKA